MISYLKVLGDINRTRSKRFLLVPRTVLISPVSLVSGDLLARIWRFWRVRTAVIIRDPPGLSHGVGTTHNVSVSVLEVVATVAVPNSTQTLCSLVISTVYLAGLCVISLVLTAINYWALICINVLCYQTFWFRFIPLSYWSLDLKVVFNFLTQRLK